jgi:hypothetical protein
VYEDVHTLAEYCRLEKISRSKVYSEWAEGIGIGYFKRGSKIYITDGARTRHRERLSERTKVAAEAGRADEQP